MQHLVHNRLQVFRLAQQRDSCGGAGYGLREATGAASQQGPGGAARAEQAAGIIFGGVPSACSHVAGRGL